MARIEPLTPSEFPKEMRAALAALLPPNPRHPRPPTENRPKALHVLGTLAHHPELAQAYFTLNGHVLMATTLTERQRELLIMRVAAVRKCGYEWAQHLFMARDVGLSDEEIGRISYGPESPFWGNVDAALVRAVDELTFDGTLSEPTWQTLSTEFDTRQILDLIFTVGTYDLLARLFNALRMDIDDDIPALMAKYDRLF
jgi:4-carboxymuconolactone decarboxylase